MRQEARQGSRSGGHLKPHLGILLYPKWNELPFLKDCCDTKEGGGWGRCESVVSVNQVRDDSYTKGWY